MTSKQRRRLRMYLAVKRFLAEHDSITKDIPHFADSFKAFTGIIRDLEAASEEQHVNRKGIAEEKKERQDRLVVITCDYSRKLRCYAQMASDIRLEEAVRRSKSEIKDLRDTLLLAYSESVFNRAEAIDEDLSRFLITSETNLAFRKALDEFSESIDKPRLGIVSRGIATLTLNLLFREGNSRLKEIDTLLLIVERNEPSFVSAYTNIRKISKGNTGHLSLRVSVVTMATGLPLAGALVSCIPEGNNTDQGKKDKAINRKSGQGGGIAIKNMMKGNYKILIRKAGYILKETNVTLTRNERKDVVVELEKT